MDPAQGWNETINDVPILDKVKGKDQTRIFTSKDWFDLVRSGLGDA